MKQRFIITGGPCSGKTSLIEQLAIKGHSTFSEAARKVIQQELRKNSDALPWENNIAFSELVIHQQKKDHQNAEVDLNFYDRGIPDVLGYLLYYKQRNLIPLFMEKTQQFNYEKKVFILPPWEKIYAKDLERKEPFEEAQKIHKALSLTYTKLNYNLIEVPCASYQERINFILSHVTGK